MSRASSGEVEDEVDVLPMTGIVVAYNDDEYLDPCLSALSFCENLIVADLGSEDQSVQIAEDHGAQVVHHEQVPIAEIVRSNVVHLAETDWILLMDPDEVCHPILAEKATHIIRNSNQKIGKLFFPWRFYAWGRPLRGTRWGGQNHKGVLIHRDRCKLTKSRVGKELIAGYESAYVPWGDPEHCIHHYWFDSFWDLFEKHIRYLEHQGEHLYSNGVRFNGWGHWVWRTIFQFKYCYINEEGWRDGVTGLFLSLFWAWFQAASNLSLREYQKDKR